MDIFLKRKSDLPPPTLENDDCDQVQTSSKRSNAEVNLTDLPTDPGLRTQISNYHPNDQNLVRRAYLQRGPCQPRNHIFPQKKIANVLRRFNPAWFNEYGSWLEYSITKDAAFCLHCYLFRSNNRKQGGGDSFVVEGFTNWKKKERFQVHVGGSNSAHNQAYRKCQDLLNQEEHIQTFFPQQSDEAQREYKVHLNASIDCIRYLVCQGIAFCGYDESEDHEYFLDFLKFIADHNESIKSAVLNLKLIAPDIQKDIVNAIAIETTNVIIDDVGDALFAILIDESCDISSEEKMTVILRYVDKRGCVIERFLGIIHVRETTAVSLKGAIEVFFSKHGLSIKRLRGQGYNGTCNMQDEFNDLTTLIMKENGCAFYIHCFALQLQLTLTAVAQNNSQIGMFFNSISDLLNIVGASDTCRDIDHDRQVTKVIGTLKSGELFSGQGLDQETSIKRFGDTRWDSHYDTLVRLVFMFSSVIDVLDIVMEDGWESEKRGKAYRLLGSMQSFEFAFSLHLMKTVLKITNELSKALQQKEKDIVNAMTLVRISKQRLLTMRDNGWDSIINEVSLFCSKHDIIVPNMANKYVIPWRSRRRAEEITTLHYFRVELFYVVIDMQLQELNNLFTEVNTELLLCVACLNPSNSFSAFDKQRLVRLAQFYPVEFSAVDLMALDNQLETYIIDMRSNNEFSEVNEISGLAKKMVETKKNILYPLVYLLITLALILPVSTAAIERAFSAMHVVKNRLRNRMGDERMNDCLITYIEKDIFSSINNEKIIQRFQNMKTS